ncbi:MAG: Ppx/GppA family phosphatase [Rhodospirillaceae bacterium]|nr:Ppx/GppA family phosphatase [Rhodospirillaceae bacterium]
MGSKDASEDRADTGPRKPVAVIDIGSNSVRLVAYNGMTRTPIPLHNEKVICALGKGLERSGALNSDGVGMAFNTVSRFVEIARALGAERIDALAAAAVRDARDGAAFAKALEKRCDIKVQILTGKQEARRSALGVLCGTPDAEGVVADLGGGSLELVQIGHGEMNDHTTLPLGLLRLSEASDNDRAKAIGIINKALDKHKWISSAKDKTLYAVGGAWRALARVCIAQMDYPLHVLDNFALDRAHAIRLFDVIARLSAKSLEQIKGVSRSRLVNLPLAAAVLERLLEITKPKSVVFSIYGMREGQFYKSLPDHIRKQDPLVSLAEEIARSSGRNPQVGHETCEWMTPLFKDESARQRKLRLAACLMRDVAWTEHPDYRAEQAFLKVLRLPFLGLDHEDRAGLALAMYYRYASEPSEPIIEQAHALLDNSRIHRVRTAGLALRLTYALSAGAPGVLKRTSIRIEGGKLVLTMPEDDPMLTAAPYARRLKRLADHLGLGERVDFV